LVSDLVSVADAICSNSLLHPQLRMEPMAGIEPATDGLRNRCSTAELHWLAQPDQPHSWFQDFGSRIRLIHNDNFFGREINLVSALAIPLNPFTVKPDRTILTPRSHL
jgi:hypothetical protein